VVEILGEHPRTKPTNKMETTKILTKPLKLQALPIKTKTPSVKSNPPRKIFCFTESFIRSQGFNLFTSRGKKVASFTLGKPSNCIIILAGPIPTPPCGGHPYLKKSK